MTCECISAKERKPESITELKENILLNVVFRRASSKVPKSGGNFLFRTLGFFCLFFFLYFKKKFGGTLWHMGCEFPDQGSHLHPLHWKGGVLTTAPPGRPQDFSWDLTKSETWTLFPLPWGGESSPTPQACGVSSICEVSSSQLTSFYDLANLSYLVLKSAG